MIKHYLKVSFRNLWKYKYQTLVSVVGLAVGFACFAMAALWIRYEMSYDGFHKNADRLYRVSIKDVRYGGLTPSIEFPLDAYLKKTFPEVKKVARILSGELTVEVDDIKSKTRTIFLKDSSFLEMFDIKILSGNSDFIIHENKQIAVTQEKAVQLFGNENPLGKTIKLEEQEYTVGAIVSGYSSHSNYPFEAMTASEPSFIQYFSHIIVELVPGINVKSFTSKLYEHKATVAYQLPHRTNKVSSDAEKISLTPLTSIHYKNITGSGIKFQHIIIFAIAGSLLILCTLLNYLALFISRFRIRMRELTLRIVCGATNRSLFTLLSVEFLMSLVISLSLGIFLIYLIIPHFRRLSGVDIELSFIYVESLTYIATIILVSLLTFLTTLYVFRRRTLNVTVRKGNSKMFRKTSIVAQLIISMIFAFCTVIILKQMYHLRNTDLGFSLKNHGCVQTPWSPPVDLKVLAGLLQQIPEIEKIAIGDSMLEVFGGSPTTYDWDERPKDMEQVSLVQAQLNEDLSDLYEFQLVAGEMLTDNDSDDYVMINESAAKIFGWKDPAGKHFTGNYKYQSWSSSKIYTVKGVIKDIYRSSFSEPVSPMIFKHEAVSPILCVLFKYREGTWTGCKEKITRILNEKYPDIVNDVRIYKEEFNYDRYLKSENTLFAILTIISIVCVIVCIFGFVSMVALTCEERRKEIAIRKINGATIKDILDLFFKEYLTLLIIGAMIALPAGYLIMRRWLENYVLQTEMSAWIYFLILLTLFMAIVLCVGGRVYKTSRENPINAIQKV
ncbi:MAG: ABC transporter permease [Prevotellaceae bacterium]|jgi:hypothetical protein|nr:ABC transporter permease [Prevotellaceae bacterium]